MTVDTAAEDLVARAERGRRVTLVSGDASVDIRPGRRAGTWTVVAREPAAAHHPRMLETTSTADRADLADWLRSYVLRGYRGG